MLHETWSTLEQLRSSKSRKIKDIKSRLGEIKIRIKQSRKILSACECFQSWFKTAKILFRKDVSKKLVPGDWTGICERIVVHEFRSGNIVGSNVLVRDEDRRPGLGCLQPTNCIFTDTPEIFRTWCPPTSFELTAFNWLPTVDMLLPGWSMDHLESGTSRSARILSASAFLGVLFCAKSAVLTCICAAVKSSLCSWICRFCDSTNCSSRCST